VSLYPSQPGTVTGSCGDPVERDNECGNGWLAKKLEMDSGFYVSNPPGCSRAVKRLGGVKGFCALLRPVLVVVERGLRLDASFWHSVPRIGLMLGALVVREIVKKRARVGRCVVLLMISCVRLKSELQF
jgi:hypothetical protein